ncbi:hypothetical protein [Sphingomonas oryzagri]
MAADKQAGNFPQTIELSSDRDAAGFLTGRTAKERNDGPPLDGEANGLGKMGHRAKHIISGCSQHRRETISKRITVSGHQHQHRQSPIRTRHMHPDRRSGARGLRQENQVPSGNYDERMSVN